MDATAQRNSGQVIDTSGGGELGLGDRLAIHELPALYSHLIDPRRWSELECVFALDIVSDMMDIGHGVITSLEDHRELWADAGTQHPVAHHESDIVVERDDRGAVRVLPKGFEVGSRRRVGSAIYRDEVVVHTPDRWRLSHRIVTALRTQ